ncbi:hypothetical protein J2Z76_003108 [Sedimentibacter acidaminivorans]|uniref:Uncharacterized protein n=1 Tax=Sedimentibacter acidaminivorans TaxID=913099 RepID=A0ABS4GHQ0_9FIRM|nr:hypothetical protein [Sedimentibacter acidaminivorans]
MPKTSEIPSNPAMIEVLLILKLKLITTNP